MKFDESIIYFGFIPLIVVSAMALIDVFSNPMAYAFILGWVFGATCMLVGE